MRIDTRVSRLDAAFERARCLEEASEIQADFASYLCILISGFLEKSVKTVLTTHSRARSAPSVARYVERTIRIGNLNAPRLVELVGHFDPEQRNSLKTFLTGERTDAINGIHSNRNHIAHGTDVDLTYLRVKHYYEKIKEVVAFLERKLK